MDEATLIDYLKGEAGQEDCLLVETWCEESAGNRKRLEELYYLLFIGNRLSAMNAVDVEKSLARFKKSVQEKNKKAFHWSRYATSIAAFMAGLILAGGASWLLSKKDSSNYMVYTGMGQRAQAILPDGTKVWLNSSTQLAYKTSFWHSERQVDLTGEAYFEVTHDEHTPFTVNSKEIKTCVLGTKFNVRAHSSEERVVTTLFKGSVRIDTPQNQESGFLLEPGQTLDVDANTYQAELIEYSQPQDVLLWMNGKLTFENATLIEITNTLEKSFDVHFTFASEQLKRERYTCEFNTDDKLNDILSVISLTKRLDYEKKGDKVLLKSK